MDRFKSTQKASIFGIIGNIFLESYNVLMDKTISLENKKKVMDIIMKHKEIKKGRTL